MGHASLGLYSAFDALLRLSIACDGLRESIGMYLPDDAPPTRGYDSRSRAHTHAATRECQRRATIVMVCITADAWW
jgi:hypothetical protein